MGGGLSFQVGLGKQFHGSEAKLGRGRGMKARFPICLNVMTQGLAGWFF